MIERRTAPRTKKENPTEEGGTYRRRRTDCASLRSPESSSEPAGSSSSSSRVGSASSRVVEAGSMPDTSGSMGWSTPVGYRSSGDILTLLSEDGPMSCLRSHATSLFLASTYINSGLGRMGSMLPRFNCYEQGDSIESLPGPGLSFRHVNSERPPRDRQHLHWIPRNHARYASSGWRRASVI